MQLLTIPTLDTHLRAGTCREKLNIGHQDLQLSKYLVVLLIFFGRCLLVEIVSLGFAGLLPPL